MLYYYRQNENDQSDEMSFERVIYSRNSQAPGPVGRTVSIPLRKSGIPVDVETPAPDRVLEEWRRWEMAWWNFDYSPVKMMKCLLSLIHWANWSSFWSRSCCGSKYSFFMSGSESPWAIGEASDRRQVTMNTECAEPTRVTSLYRFADLVALWCNYLVCVKRVHK